MFQQAIDVYASQPHYLDHMEPIWHALPDDVRGDVLVGARPLVHHRLVVEAQGREFVKREAWRISRVLVAGAADMRTARRSGWGTALLEHGAGQTYDGERKTGSYAGGDGRDKVGLFLCTNRRVAEANDAVYGRRSVVVGSPRLAALAAAREAHRAAEAPVLALAWHWPCDRVAPEAFWAFPEFVESLAGLRQHWPGTVLGHAHPRAWKHVVHQYREAGIEPVRQWEDVVKRADVVSFDNTSVGFEAAALGIPVVLCDSLRWRRRVHHGLRFWDHAEIGPTVTPGLNSPALAIRWADAAMQSLHDVDPRWEVNRRQMAWEVYPHQEDAIERAVLALCRWVGFRP